MSLVERLAERCFAENPVLSKGVWVEASRWWLRAIAEELEAADVGNEGEGTFIARWLREQAGEEG